jgi:uncharacterized membrane protein YidH (DUF202 family)
MKRKSIFGVLLIVLGLAALAYGGISYTSREKALDLGDLQITTERTKRIPLSPVVGVIAVVGGIVLLLRNTKADSL